MEIYSKGDLFEWYIIRLFNRQHFRLHKWRRSKKIVNRQDLVNYGFPDLEWELVFSGANKHHFAVECKWREKFRDGKIEWAREDEIERYVQFQRSRNITVFVVIGVGGQPGSPEKLYVTPLDEIAGSGEVDEEQLREYKRGDDEEVLLLLQAGGVVLRNDQFFIERDSLPRTVWVQPSFNSSNAAGHNPQ